MRQQKVSNEQCFFSQVKEFLGTEYRTWTHIQSQTHLYINKGIHKIFCI